MRLAHFQVSVWKAVLDKRHEVSKSLLPVTVPEGAAIASLDVIKVIRCGCATDQPCANDACVEEDLDSDNDDLIAMTLMIRFLKQYNVCVSLP